MVLSDEIQQDVLTRMRRIEGQARGVQKMIADDRDCLEILTQLASLRSAAYSVSVALTQHFALQCVRDAGQPGLPPDQWEVPDDAMRNLVDVLLRTPH